MQTKVLTICRVAFLGGGDDHNRSGRPGRRRRVITGNVPAATADDDAAAVEAVVDAAMDGDTTVAAQRWTLDLLAFALQLLFAFLLEFLLFQV